MRVKLFKSLIMVALLAFLGKGQATHAAGRCYVNSLSTLGANTGLSWQDAYLDLQDALADSCTEIWVAVGTYLPHPTDPNISFNLESGTKMYGGFLGFETDLSQRNLNFIYNTILSGDLGRYKSHPILYANGVNNTAILDGFLISSGCGDDNSVPNVEAGGMVNINSSPTLRNLRFSDFDYCFGADEDEAPAMMVFNNNSSPSFSNVEFINSSGPGLMNWNNSNPSFEHVTFTNIHMAMANWNSNPILRDVIFSNNHGIQGDTSEKIPTGAAMYNNNSSPILTDVIFDNNSFKKVAITLAGAGMHNYRSSPSLTNVTFSNNRIDCPKFTGSCFARGAAMANFESAPSMENVNFINNSLTCYLDDDDSVDNFCQGAGMYNNNSSPSLNLVTFQGNYCEAFGNGEQNDSYPWDSYCQGGAMANFNGSSIVINKASFLNNSANCVESYRCHNFGGAIFNENSNPVISNSVFMGNSAKEFSVNTGSAIFSSSGSMAIHQTSFIANQFDSIVLQGGTLTIDNSSFIGNIESGIINIHASLMANHLTVASNGQGIQNNGELHLQNSILARNGTTDCYNNGDSIATNIQNLIEVNGPGGHQCGLPFSSENPLFEAIGYFGGSTLMYSLQSASPAIDNADSATCLPTDQRGILRPQLNACDIGAFEYTSIPIVDPPTEGQNDDRDDVEEISELDLLPDTGFAPNTITQLPPQRANNAYSATDITLEIPKLNVRLPILGVPYIETGWDVTWLRNAAGWLEGTAFPTWAGNSVITAHVWDAQNNPGPFANLKELNYGDTFRILAHGLIYTYEVRVSKLVQPDDLSVLGHSELDVVTLLTCENFTDSTGNYSNRRAVHAVLVNITGNN